MAVESNTRRRSVKIFQPRPSLYDQLFHDNAHFCAVYRAWQVEVAIVFAFVVLRDSYRSGRFHVNTSSFISDLGSVSDIVQLVLLESALLCTAFLVHPVFKLWRLVRPSLGRLSEVLFIAIFAGYVVVSWYFMAVVALSKPLPPILRIIATAEQLRLSMKSYSFVRENAYKVLYPWDKEDKSGPAVWYGGQMDPKVGSFSQYCYFLFAPTLLYRDHYPRSPGPVNWWNAVGYLVQFLSTISCAFVLFKDVMYPASFFQDDLIYSFLVCLPFGLLELCLAHACLLHAWKNLGAELTRFGDREFYTDWWNAHNHASYYRKWNLPVHEWLFAYIYQDLRKVVSGPGNGWMAMIPVLLISSVIHDYLISVGVGVCTPFFIFIFGGVGAFAYAVQPFRNHKYSAQVYTMASLGVGSAMIMWVCLVQLASQYYCPEGKLSLESFFSLHFRHCFQQFN